MLFGFWVFEFFKLNFGNFCQRKLGTFGYFFKRILELWRDDLKEMGVLVGLGVIVVLESWKSQIEAFKNKDSQEKLLESFNNIRDDWSRKERRKRRTAVEIERKYRCRYRGCNKSYGSEGSLNQHMKNKHPRFYQKFLETLNISNLPVESPEEYEPSSSSSTSKLQKKRNIKEEEKTEENRPLPNSKSGPSLRKKNNKN